MSDPNDPGAAGGGPPPSDRAGRTRVGDSGSPVGSPLTIVLSVIAVVVGFFIFRTIDSGGSVGAGPQTPGQEPQEQTQPNSNGTQAPGGTTAAPGPTTTTEPTIDPEVRVIVINAGEVSQSAGSMSDELEAEGFTMVDAVSDDDEATDEETVVQFLQGSGPTVQTTAQVAGERLGGVNVTGVEEAPAVAQGDTVGAATVFVLLGADLAGEELPIDEPSAPTTPEIVGPATQPAGNGDGNGDG